MKKWLHNEANGLDYVLIDGRYYPALICRDNEKRPIGKWGERHKKYIAEKNESLYFDLLVSGRLNTYLADINERAERMFELLVKQMMKLEGVTEELKCTDCIQWIRKVSSIRNRAEEIVNSEIIYA